MRILLLNPNTSDDFTRKIARTAEKYAATTTQITALNPNSGPQSIECIYDELLSAPGSLQVLIPQLDQQDGIIVACYSDHPLIYAIREITDKPVIGIAEASMLMAVVLGHSFSIITTNTAWQPLLWEAVRRYGFSERCRSIRTTGLPVLALEGKSESELVVMLAHIAQVAVTEDGAEVICLGCAGMAGADHDLQQQLGVPVLDGVVCAVKMMEGILGYGLKTSKRNAYQTPGFKKILSQSELFSQMYSKPVSENSA